MSHPPASTSSIRTATNKTLQCFVDVNIYVFNSLSGTYTHMRYFAISPQNQLQGPFFSKLYFRCRYWSRIQARPTESRTQVHLGRSAANLCKCSPLRRMMMSLRQEVCYVSSLHNPCHPIMADPASECRCWFDPLWRLSSTRTDPHIAAASTNASAGRSLDTFYLDRGSFSVTKSTSILSC